MNPPTRIETERLILRPYQKEDALIYLEFCDRNRDHLMPFEAGNPARYVRTLIQSETLLNQFALDWSARVAFFYGAWMKNNPRELAAQLYIGVVTPELPEFEMGYIADVAHEGKGYVSESVRAGLKMLFGELGAHRVRLECNELNERSWRVAERCGFKREGHRRQTRRIPLLPNGKFSGDYLYAVLRDEYKQSIGSG